MAQKKSKKPMRSKSKEDISTAKAFFYVSTFFVLLIVTVFTLHYRHGLQLYLCANYGKFCNNFLTDQADGSTCSLSERGKVTTFNIRNLELIEQHVGTHIFGVDVSEYQGAVNWESVYCVENSVKIDFLIIRATAGIDKVDDKFKDNWKEVKKANVIRGAYHYYRPDEDPIDQAQNFIKHVQLAPKDLPPILDVEKSPKNLSRDEFIKNIQTWIDLVTKHYKVKPILYSGQNFHENYLSEHFPDYILWIANYNFFTETMQPHWHFWQFTEKGYVAGIKGNVDVNMFRGSVDDLKQLTIK